MASMEILLDTADLHSTQKTAGELNPLVIVITFMLAHNDPIMRRTLLNELNF